MENVTRASLVRIVERDYPTILTEARVMLVGQLSRTRKVPNSNLAQAPFFLSGKSLFALRNEQTAFLSQSEKGVYALLSAKWS